MASQFEAVTVVRSGSPRCAPIRRPCPRGRNAARRAREFGDKQRPTPWDRGQEPWWDCVEQSEIEVVRSRSAAMAIFRGFDPCRVNMWVGTGCGGISQVWATSSLPVQDALGGTTPFADAAGARPIAEAAAATASTHANHRMTLCPPPVAPRLRAVRRSCLPSTLVAMSMTFIKWTWQLLIPRVPGEPPHIRAQPWSARRTDVWPSARPLRRVDQCYRLSRSAATTNRCRPDLLAARAVASNTFVAETRTPASRPAIRTRGPIDHGGLTLHAVTTRPT
jgi:hypothetical protein